MKKNLTKDITRYDSKMILKVDMATFKALILGVVISLPIAVPLWIFYGMLYGLLISIVIALAVFILRVGKIQGIRLIDYIIALIIHSVFPTRWKKSFNYKDGDYRIRINTDEELKNGRIVAENEKAKFKNKNKKKP